MLLRTGAALIAGVVLSLAFEPVAVEVVVPFALAAFFLTLRGVRAARAWLPGLAFGTGFMFVHLFWMRAVGPDAWIALSALQAAFFAPLGVAVALAMRHRLWPLWVAGAWVGVEAVRGEWPFGGMPWGRLAYSVADTPLEDSLPYAGHSGVSLVLALSGAALAWLVVADGRRRLAPAGVLAGLVAVTLVPVLVPHTTTSTGSRTVAVVQGNVPGDGSDILLDHRQVTENHVQATIGLAGQVREGGEPAPDFVLWPENSTAVDPFTDGSLGSGIQTAATAVDVPILVGAMIDAGAEHVLNQGIVWTPGTGGGDRYTKRHPVPFGEYIPWRSVFRGNFGKLELIPRDMMSGTRSDPLRIADTDVADAICFDIAYDDGIHEQLRHGGQLVVVQTSNAMFIHTAQIQQQYEITRLRARETGRYVLVAATNGVSGVIAPDGTILAEADPRTQAVLVEQVGLATELTPAVVIGPWSGRVCAAVGLLGVALGVLPYRRRSERA